MRSSPVKIEKKPVKLTTKRASSIKKKKLVDMKPPVRDTVSETISFVIKGKLTPIKPILIDNKFDILGRTNKKLSNCGKIVKKKNTKINQKPVKQLIKKTKQKSKPKTKVQIETAKKPSAQTTLKRSAEKIIAEVISNTPKEVLKKNTKSEIPTKITKSKPVAKPLKIKKEVPPKPAKPKIKKETTKRTKKEQEIELNQKTIAEPSNQTDENADEIKKQQTIEELLKQVNEELIENKKANKLKKQKSKAKKETGEVQKDKILKNDKEPESETKLTVPKKTIDKKIEAPLKVEPEITFVPNEIPDEITLKELSEVEKSDLPVETVKAEPIFDAETKVTSKKIYKKIKTEPEMTIIKKRVISKNREHDLQRVPTKLFGFWNGPKRHRVASLNALAKVHCLYENETRGNILDVIEESDKLDYLPKSVASKLSQADAIKQEKDESEDTDRTSSPIPTRTLRSAPGLRGVGKHWDMHETTSSSEETSDEDNSKDLPLKEIKKEKPSKPLIQKDSERTKQEKKRNRKQNELMMDLKDMVVRKRMASLNASAILAASYSVERRQTKAVKSDGDSTDSYDGSSEEYFAASDNDIKQEDDGKKEEKLIEVHTTPNKKVAVILNQDTDVTITGVYVNSTTRSTHHEGYCSIAGMQYRISATSHTQTAATAVATETLLQSSSNSAPDNSNSDSLPSSKSYTPLDALSNMQPPPGPGIQHNHPVIQQPPMGPPQHVLPLPAHQLSPGLRHSCSSAFSSPHSTPTYQIPPGHHPAEPGYVHAGYYQPAGPLITVPHGGHAPPPPVPLSKSVPLSESSPTSTTPSVTGHETTQAPSSNRDGGDSSDSEVIITSVTTAKDPPTPLPPPPPHPSYRYAQYPPTPPGYSYPHYPPYHYPTPPPASYGHHELCYSYKYPAYRRYLGQYYPPAGVQEVYPPSGQPQQSQQVVPTPAPATTNPSSGPPFPSSGPPPPPIMDPYPPPPQPTLVEPYQSPHYYPPPAPFGPPPPPPSQCYAHAGSTRGMPFINATYQSCPCPMQSCPKNVLTGPLTGDSKRSNIASISKDSMPLPPVALALPLEPASETGPPSPARGSAGMPPPPSPAGATYQPPPPPTKQESQSTLAPEDCKKRKARIGKAMVRNNIAAGMQHNTMLLMCNPSQNYVSAVKREIESPKEKEIVEEKKERCCSDDEVKPASETLQVPFAKTEEPPVVEVTPEPVIEPKEEKLKEEVEEVVEIQENTTCSKEDIIINEVLPPVISTVAENVKVKNMKRKLSLTKEKVPEPDVVPPPKKKPKLSSYKLLIKKDTNSIKINNGKRKLIEDPPVPVTAQTKRSTSKSKKPTKRKLSVSKEEFNKRLKLTKPLVDSNVTNAKQSAKAKVEDCAARKVTKKMQVNSKIPKSAPAVLDNLIAKNSIDRTIDSVVSVVKPSRTSKEVSVLKAAVSRKTSRDALPSPSSSSSSSPSAAASNNNNSKKSTNKNVQNKAAKSESRKPTVSKRKTKSNVEVAAQAVAKVPRRSLHLPRWSNGWRWDGDPYEAKVFINSDEMTLVRKCYPAMMHETGDKIFLRDCVLLKAGPRKNDLPFVAKIAALWENPDDGEMMMSLLWYYRPEHTEQGRLPTDQPDEVFASRHKDSNSVACIDDKCYVLTFNEYCRYRKRFKRIEEGIEETLPCIPNPEPYPRINRQPPSSQISPEMVFFCRRVYDFRQKRIMKNPT